MSVLVSYLELVVPVSYGSKLTYRYIYLNGIPTIVVPVGYRYVVTHDLSMSPSDDHAMLISQPRPKITCDLAWNIYIFHCVSDGRVHSYRCNP